MEWKRWQWQKDRWENGSCRVENDEMGTESGKKEQDKKRIREGDSENCIARRQTSECKATLEWTREKERRRLRGKKDDGDNVARLKEKRKAKEKVDEFGKRRHEKGWS